MLRAKDPGYAMVRALERPDGTPSRILSESTVRSKRSLDNPSITDAYILARNEQTVLDIDRVAELAKVPREVAIQHLLDTDAVLRTPGGGYEPADQHLSGNVRKKLAEAQQALAQGEPMQHTADRLTAAIPETVPYFTIEAKLGAPWVGDAAYKSFIGELLGQEPGDTKGIGVQFVGNRWKVTLTDSLRSKPEADLWSHNAFWFDNFIGKAMGNETLRVMDPADKDGGPYFNAAASEEANAKAQALREKFSDWAWADPERKVAFEQAYNQTINAIAKPEFDGSFMDMSGMALRRGEDAFSLRRHQVNAIWRGVIQGRGCSPMR
jgi:N12 class adenine-specific DNA methylase